MSLITVVIPCYRHERYVAQAIDSVLDQHWPEVELIVIDDGSPDNSVAVIEQKLDERGGFRFIQQRNSGLLTSLARGLSEAQGEYFCQLASDDYLPADSLAKRARYLQQHPDCVAVFSDGLTVLHDTLTDERFIDDKRRHLLDQSDPIPAMLHGTMPVFATGLMRTDALRRCGGFDPHTFRFYEDLDTPIRLALEGRLAYLDEPLFYRREHDTNVSRSTPHIRVEKTLAYRKLLSMPSCAPYRRLLQQRLMRSYLALGRHILRCATPDARDLDAFRSARHWIWRNPKLLSVWMRVRPLLSD